MKWRREWFIRVPWGNLTMVSRGHPDGNPVLLIHGRQDSLSIFEPLIKHMSEQYYYVAIDMPGNGLSDAFPHGPKLMRFHFLYAMELALIHLGWDNFIFIGHSMGCEQGLFYNVLYPGQITKMILLDAGPTLMRMQIEDNAEYQSLFYDPYYENYKEENIGRKIRYKYMVTDSMQRLRNLSRAQCSHLLTRNFHEIDWHPIQGWHPNEIKVVARKTFLVVFDDDQDEKLLPNGTRTMVLWNLKENDLIKLDDHVVLKQYPDEPLNIYADGEKVKLIIHLTKTAHVETMTEFPLDTIDGILQYASEDNSDEYESMDEYRSGGEDSNNNHDIPTGVPKDLGPAQQVFFLRTTLPCEPDEAQSDNNGNFNEDQYLEFIEEEEESNEMQSSVEGQSNHIQVLDEEILIDEQSLNEEQSLNDVQSSNKGRTSEEQGINEGILNGKQTSNKKRYYYCDVCVVFSKVLGHPEIRKAHRLEDLEKQLKKMTNSSPEDTVSIGCQTLRPIAEDDQNSNETNSNLISFESECSLRSNETESSNRAQNVREEHGSEELFLIANANCVAENPEPSNAIQAQSSNMAHGSNEAPNLSEAQNGNRPRDGEEPNEQGRPGNANGQENSETREVEATKGLIHRTQEHDKVVGYLSWDNRLKNLAPQNYGNDYYFELFKSIPPTLLVAASDGAKNVPNPKWRQGAKELLDRMATLDNFHRVDVEGSHDVHYTHPERVLPFINAFLEDNKVSSKL